jgi:hypothetical protein
MRDRYRTLGRVCHSFVSYCFRHHRPSKFRPSPNLPILRNRRSSQYYQKHVRSSHFCRRSNTRPHATSNSGPYISSVAVGLVYEESVGICPQMTTRSRSACRALWKSIICESTGRLICRSFSTTMRLCFSQQAPYSQELSRLPYRMWRTTAVLPLPSCTTIGRPTM